LQTAIDNNIHNSGVTEVLEVTSCIYIRINSLKEEILYNKI
jgi:hypothetical protein